MMPTSNLTRAVHPHHVRRSRGGQGFTLIELLIASSAFVILMGSLGGIYLTFVRRHKVEIQKQTLQQDISVFFEALDREVRTAYGTTFGPTVPATGGSELYLKNQNLECVKYRLGTGANAGRLIRDVLKAQPTCDPAAAFTPTSSDPVTSRQTDVRRLQFFGIQTPVPMEVIRGAPGIVSAWTFDEFSGPAVADISNNGHTGQHQNNPTVSLDVAPSSPNLRSLQLNGTNQYVSVPDSTDWDLTGDFTMTAWVKFAAEDLAGPGTTFISHAEGSGFGTGWAWLRPGDGSPAAAAVERGKSALYLFDGGTQEVVAGTEWSPATNTWYHLAVTRSGGTYTFYRNGASDGTEQSGVTVPDAAGELRLGQTGETAYLSGTIDDTRLYNRPLSDQEIATLAAGNELPGSGSFILTGNQGRVSVSLRACPRNRPEAECSDLQTTITSRQRNAPPNLSP